MPTRKRQRNRKPDLDGLQVGPASVKRQYVQKRGDVFGEGHSRGNAGTRYTDEIDFDEGLPPRVLSPVRASETPVEDPESEIEDVIIAPPHVQNQGESVVVHKADTAPPAGITEEQHTSLATVEVPKVLTWEAVRKNALAKDSEGGIISGLPKSLEQDVPPEFRYWKCTTAEKALAVREALVEAGIFTPDTIRKVDGEVRRVSVKRYVSIELPPEYPDYEFPIVPAQRRAIDKAAELLESSDRETTLFPEDVVEAIGFETVLEKAMTIEDGDWLIAAQYSDKLLKSLNIPAFRIHSREDVLFVTNAGLTDPDNVVWVGGSRIDAVLKSAFDPKRVIPLLKASEEERLILGIVLEPDEVDAQDDTVSPEEIRQACHKFMEDFGTLGVQHRDFTQGRLHLLENFIAPVNFKVDGELVKKGSWVMAQRVVDDKLWKGIKAGDYTGYSIGGSAVKKPAR